MRLSILVTCFLAEIWIFEKRLHVDQFWSKEVTYEPLFLLSLALCPCAVHPPPSSIKGNLEDGYTG